MSHYEPIPLAVNELWTPGANYSIDGEYPTPTQDELRDLWHDYVGPEATVVSTPGVYGAMHIPEAPPLHYVSVDACEVIRNTNIGVILAQRSPEDLARKRIKSIHRYGEGCSYEDNYADIQSLTQVLINADLIEPVAGIEEISDMMQRWRKMGAYVIFNTSTLPGCEPGTIRFLQRYLPGAGDALLLPRNHDSHKSLPSKGDVAARLALAVEQAVFGDKEPDTELRRDVTAIHIDDKSCHNKAFRVAMTAIGATVHTVQPIYPSHLEVDETSVQASTPLDAFTFTDILMHGGAAQTTSS
ncbi:MAG TPA: hypothetical protein VJ843_02025 [Candidatus Saccharimonadales bacterium]|nr:hypothetical protein [Candidatus Saccharimonadales bacterium]